MSESPNAPRRPNVILVIPDDLGSVDLNCYGVTDLHTPNLDALVAPVLGKTHRTEF